MKDFIGRYQIADNEIRTNRRKCDGIKDNIKEKINENTIIKKAIRKR